MGKLKEILRYRHNPVAPTLATSLTLVGILGGLAFAKNYYSKTEVQEPFRSALTEYQNKLNTEEGCNYGADIYVRRTVEKNHRGEITKISETEITCGKWYIPALALSARFIVAEREIFPDGRVNVLRDPGNKYKPSTTQIK